MREYFFSNRFNDHWRFVIQCLSFLASFLLYLETGQLASRLEVANLLGGDYYISLYNTVLAGIYCTHLSCFNAEL